MADSICPLCGASAARVFEKHGIWIMDCTGCGHRFADLVTAPDHVANQYDDQYFRGGGAGYADYLGESALLREHGRRYGRLLKRHAPPGALLDVGAAAGFLLQGFEDEGWNGTGVEPNETMAAYARDELGLDVRYGTLEDFPRGEKFDVVSVIQVIAHVADPRIAFSAIADLTRPDGLCLIETWNRNSKLARLCGKHWHEYSPPTVLHWFSSDGLSKAFAQYGFQEVARGRPAKYLNGAHAKSLLRYKLGRSLPGRTVGALLGVVPNRLKIRYPAEDLSWTLLRRV